MTERRLLITRRSPYARKVRIVLLEKNLACTDVDTDLGHKPAELLNSGPMQKVPVLFDGGVTIADSTVICEYLEERYPDVKLFPDGYLLRAQVRMWDEMADSAAECAVKLYMNAQKPPAQQHGSDIAAAESLMGRILNHADAEVKEKQYLVDNRFTLADAALASAVGYVGFRLGDGWRQSHTNLAAWFDRISTRKSLADTLPRV